MKDMPAQEMADVMSGLLAASITAKRSLDSATSELAKIYWADPVLRTLPLPAFGIAEVTVRLKFAIARGQPPAKGAGGKGLLVIVDTASLEQLPEHLVSEMEIKLSPRSVRVYEAEGQGVLVGES